MFSSKILLCDVSVCFQYIISTFLLPSATQKIFCSSSVVDDITSRQPTLSELLFDAAEEHALTVLLDAWTAASANDLSVFRRVGTAAIFIADYVELSVVCTVVMYVCLQTRWLLSPVSIQTQSLALRK